MRHLCILYFNRQNGRIFAPSRELADESGGIHRKRKFHQGVMIWSGVCCDGVTRPIIIKESTINHQKYIKDILPIALKDGCRLMENEFTFQQEGTPAHKDHHT